MKDMETDYSKKNYYHVCSEGTRCDLLFTNEIQFAAGMNIIALAVYQSKIEILAFCIMNNHFHFLVNSNLATIELFIKKINQCYFVRRKHWLAAVSKSDELKWDAIPIKKSEHLLNAIAYILRNPMDAFYDKSIFNYKWGTAMLYFREPEDIQDIIGRCKTIKQLGVSATRRILGTRNELPDHWLVTSKGYVWPGSYIDPHYVEGIFGTFHQFLYYMSSKRESKSFELQYQYRQRVVIPDIQMKEMVVQACGELFNKSKLSDLTLDQKCDVAEYLIKKYGCHQKQLFRLMQLDFKAPEDVE